MKTENNDKLNVLVFDDSENHRLTAKITLKGHNLTVVGTYDEAQKALLPVTDHDKVKQRLNELFGDFNPWRAAEAEAEKKEAYHLAEDQALKDFTTVPNFDAVLTDLMVPPSDQAQGDKYKYANQEMPLGAIIALLAISNGIKKVAVVTDTNHHKHPASAALDCFRGVGGDDVKVLCTNNVNFINLDEKTMEEVENDFLYTPEGEAKYPGDWQARTGLISGKNWGKVLERLIKR